MNLIHRNCVCLLFVVWIISTTSARGQSIWTMRGENSSIEIEYLHPVLQDESIISSAEIITLSAAVKSGRKEAFIFEIPFVTGAISPNFSASSVSQSAMGNPYIGVLFESAGAEVFGEVGVRLPLMNEHSTTAAAVGITGDFDRFEAYTPNLFLVGGALNVKPKLGHGLSFRFRFGPSLALATRSFPGAEVLLNYGIIMGLESKTVDGGVGVVGKASTSGAAASNPSIEQIECSLRFHIDSFHPAIQLRTPLDDSLTNVYEVELGLSLAIEL